MAERARVSRRWLYAAWTAAAAILAAYYGLWRYAAGRMEAAVAAFVQDQRAAGVTVEHGALGRTGFPFFLHIRIDAPRIVAPGLGAWRAERAAIDVLPYDLSRIILSVEGEQHFRTEQAGAWTVETESLRASLGADKTRSWKLSMSVRSARAAGEDETRLRLDALDYDLAPQPDDPGTLSVVAAARGLGVDRGAGEAAFETLNLMASLTRTDALDGAAPLPAWRRAGGVLDLVAIEARVNGAALTAEGQIYLDKDYYPAGELRAGLSKPVGLADAIAATGLATREEADAAAAGLGLAAMREGGTLHRTLALRGGAVEIDGARVADLPSLRAIARRRFPEPP